MKKIALKTYLLLITFVGFSVYAQNFMGKENLEIAQMFINQTNYGKDKTKAKTFQASFNQHLNNQFNQNNEAKNLEMALLFSKIYELNKDASFEFLMTTHDRNSMKNMLPHFSKEQRDWVRQKAKNRVQKYVENQKNSTNSTTTSNSSNTQISPYTKKPYEFDRMGFYDLKFRNSNFKIFFPPSTLYHDYNPLYLPAMKYKFNYAPTGIVKDLDYKRSDYKGSRFVSFRFVPNTYNNPLSESESMVLYAVAANHLFPSTTLPKSKRGRWNLCDRFGCETNWRL